jgi:hypothetical protein
VGGGRNEHARRSASARGVRQTACSGDVRRSRCRLGCIGAGDHAGEKRPAPDAPASRRRGRAQSSRDSRRRAAMLRKIPDTLASKRDGYGRRLEALTPVRIGDLGAALRDGRGLQASIGEVREVSRHCVDAVCFVYSSFSFSNETISYVIGCLSDVSIRSITSSYNLLI